MISSTAIDYAIFNNDFHTREQHSNAAAGVVRTSHLWQDVCVEFEISSLDVHCTHLKLVLLSSLTPAQTLSITAQDK
jgi:hypothetical protein